MLFVSSRGAALLSAPRKRTAILALSVSSLFMALQAQSSEAQKALSKADRRYFIENKGQWPSEVLYLTRVGGLDFWITQDGMNLNFFQLEELPEEKSKAKRWQPQKFQKHNYRLLGHRVILRLQNCNAHPRAEGREKLSGYHNYLIGRDPSRHASFVRLYREAVVKGVYRRIDMRYYFEGGRVRYDWVVHPGGDPGDILFTIGGQTACG